MSDDSVRDIVERLRRQSAIMSEILHTAHPEGGRSLVAEWLVEAADEIARLRARIIRLQSDPDRAEGFREGVRSGEAVDGECFLCDEVKGLESVRVCGSCREAFRKAMDDGRPKKRPPSRARTPIEMLVDQACLHPEEGQ